jgi:hypothetical protein
MGVVRDDVNVDPDTVPEYVCETLLQLLRTNSDLTIDPPVGKLVKEARTVIGSFQILMVPVGVGSTAKVSDPSVIWFICT